MALLDVSVEAATGASVPIADQDVASVLSVADTVLDRGIIPRRFGAPPRSLTVSRPAGQGMLRELS